MKGLQYQAWKNLERMNRTKSGPTDPGLTGISQKRRAEIFFFFLRKSRSGAELSGMLVSTASPRGSGHRTASRPGRTSLRRHAKERASCSQRDKETERGLFLGRMTSFWDAGQ